MAICTAVFKSPKLLLLLRRLCWVIKLKVGLSVFARGTTAHRSSEQGHGYLCQEGAPGRLRQHRTFQFPCVNILS